MATAPGQLQRLRLRIERTSELEPALAALSRDRSLGGSLLAAALAFRLFAVLLPLALLAAVALGYASSVDDGTPGALSDGTGLGEATLRSVGDSARLASGEAAAAAAFAFVALVYACVKAARAVHAVHSLSWTGRVDPPAYAVRGGLVMLAAIVAVAAVWAGVGHARASLGPAAVLVAVLAVVPFFGIWLTVAWLLPHDGAGWRALLPGAALVAAGLELMQLGTVLFVAQQIERASAAYGSLGVAFAILLWLFVLSRVIVGSAMLNAALRERRAPAA